ncbi:hypothetical protein BHE74_00033731 [Ensete ventricosum]|nr:hypothetical protein BHE74_00033731 [Ensete ventricosum]
MHPLRFPNSGIRAKVVRRRGGQPRPGHSQGSLHGGGCLRLGPPRKGGQRCPQRATTTRRGGAYGQKRRPRGQQPPASTTNCGQPAGAAATRGHIRLQRDARKGGRLQGAHKGLPPTRGCRPQPALPPVAVTSPVAGVVAPLQGGCQRARAATAYTGVVAAAAAQRAKEGLGHPLEKRTILPL